MSAWTRIAFTELTGSQANIEFTGIANTYSDLVLYLSMRTNRATREASVIYLQFNGATAGSNYRHRLLKASGYGVSSNQSSGDSTSLQVGYSSGQDATANSFASTTIYIPNYASSYAKPLTSDSVNAIVPGTEWDTQISGGRFGNTSVISSIKILDINGNNFLQYSSATLYGITKGSSGGVVVS